MNRMIVITAILLLTGASLLKAQPADTTALPDKWTLQQCIDYAKQHNIQLNNLRLSRQSSREDLLLAKAARLPGVSGSASQYYTHARNADPVVGGFQTQSSMASNYSVSSNWTLYQGGYLKNDVREKNLLLQTANLDVLQSENDITLQITQAYLNILLASENIVYAGDLVQTSRAQLQQGQQQFDAGSIARKDLVQLEAQLATDQYSLVAAENSYRQNLLTLKQLLQLPTSFDFSIAQPDTLAAEKPVPGLATAQQLALQTRPEVKSGELNVAIAEVGLAKAKAGYKPTLSFGASLATGFSDNQSYSYWQQLDNNFYQRAGITLGIPIFSNRANKTNEAKAKIAISQAKLSLQDTRTALSQTVEQAYLNLVNTQEQYRAAEKQLDANGESYRITVEQLKLGAVNMVDLQVQKNLYVQSLQAYIQAKYSNILNRKIYAFYTGEPVTNE
ncbi:TolC family protein [Chitinophaga japonensis]|uniref:Outer membrane protein n=1 Tax=Chitinophaga japonensis TaxID=104662 RepID=A0A562SZC1_CHIJA|nr:TolC family protein [Chitinophaga japonensis]TWI86621.1 outer membrane protein [Chitinophaga japonensis]